MIGEPFELGATQDTLMFEPTITVDGIAGVAGVSAARIETGDEVLLSPSEFSACTVNEYKVPGLRPVTK